MGTLAAELAVATLGASGSDLESLCQTATRICAKEAVGRANTCLKSVPNAINKNAFLLHVFHAIRCL